MKKKRREEEKKEQQPLTVVLMQARRHFDHIAILVASDVWLRPVPWVGRAHMLVVHIHGDVQRPDVHVSNGINYFHVGWRLHRVAGEAFWLVVVLVDLIVRPTAGRGEHPNAYRRHHIHIVRVVDLVSQVVSLAFGRCARDSGAEAGVVGAVLTTAVEGAIAFFGAHGSFGVGVKTFVALFR